MKLEKTSFTYVIIKDNYPDLARVTTFFPCKHLKSKKYAMLYKTVFKDGSELVTKIKYSNNIGELQVEANGFISWYNYPCGLYKELQQNILHLS